MILVRVRYSLRRDRLRDSDAGLRDPGAPMPPRWSAFTGIVTEGYDAHAAAQKGQNTSNKQQACCVCVCVCPPAARW